VTAAFARVFGEAGRSRRFSTEATGPDDLSDVPTDELRRQMRGTPRERLSAARSAADHFGIDDSGVTYKYNAHPRANPGQMSVNGELLLGAGAFSSWSQLGSVLGHEIEVHWQLQIVGRGWGNSDAQLWAGEYEAYNYNVDQAGRFGNSASQVEFFKAQQQRAFNNLSPLHQSWVQGGHYDRF